MKKVLLKIDGMTCSACSSGLEKYLNKQDGILNASVNLVMNNASIEYDENKLDVGQIEKFVAKAGFESLGIDKLEKEEKKKSRGKYKLWIFTAIAILTLYIAMAHMIGLPEIPVFSMHTNPINYTVILALFSAFAMYLGRDILKNGYKNLIHKTANMDTLVMLGVLSSFLYSVYGTYMIIRGSHEYVERLYYESVVIILFFINIGRYVENRNKDKTKEAIQSLMLITPNKATVIKDGKEKQVTLDEISKGDIVVCKPGEKIAVDGEVIEGVTHINEAFITGESIPAKKEVGNKVIAGSINYEGWIKYKAEKIGRDSTVSEIVKMVVEATNTKAPIAKIADKISGYFVPAIIILAILAACVWLIIGRDIAFSINVLITVLVVACPCSLGLATPLAIVASSGLASKNGILIKNSESLENAHKAKIVVFDKTGTITQGKLSVSKIYNYLEDENKAKIDTEAERKQVEEAEVEQNTENGVLSVENAKIIKIVASIENKSEHPIARGVVNYAKEKNIEPENVEEFKNIAGYGIKAKYNGNSYLVGNNKLMNQNNIAIDFALEDEKELETNGNSIIFVAENEKLIALIGLKDTIKENSKEAIKKLQTKNIEVVMLTGDNERTADVIAHEVGIHKVIANVLPKEKANQVKHLKEQGMVMMCGDGINDSVSLVTADIGVAVGSGTDIAMDSSDVVLMSDNLEKIDKLINISKRTVRNIKQNLFWAFFYNVCMIPIAMGVFHFAGITMNPMLASIAMTLSSITVTLNSLRLTRDAI